MIRNLVTSLVEHERIRTTRAKAKAIKYWADHIIQISKRPHISELSKRKRLRGFLYSKKAVNKVFEELRPRFAETNGNFAYIRPDGWRKGDGSDMSVIQYRGNPYEILEKELSLQQPKAQLPAFTQKLL